MSDRSALFRSGIEAYRDGQHYEAHELWEEIWQDEPDADKSCLVHALIQIASAVHKAKNDVAPRGALTLIDRALERLSSLPDQFMALNVAGLREEARRFREAVERELEKGSCRLDASLAPAIELVGEPLWGEAVVEPVVPAAARSAWFERGLGAYAKGDFFEAHELWEELWRDERDEDHKQFLQGLIQVAAAMHKIQSQRKPEPAARLLQRALLRLSVYPADYFGIRVDQLIRDARRAQQVLQTLGRLDDQSTTLDDELVPKIDRR